MSQSPEGELQVASDKVALLGFILRMALTHCTEGRCLPPLSAQHGGQQQSLAFRSTMPPNHSSLNFSRLQRFDSHYLVITSIRSEKILGKTSQIPSNINKRCKCKRCKRIPSRPSCKSLPNKVPSKLQFVMHKKCLLIYHNEGVLEYRIKNYTCGIKLLIKYFVTLLNKSPKSFWQK
ncbi:hypothetical protein EGR_11297 [Echinococcus granulosus]|uniref:Uncharacterized protein n=1 Tax=Echinococcus granulosus TaxID=6210 RepID=W6U689_ECHGR|nr:hypothetical protein EGR_11297 [Echinococcus granulosus]EUB53852.1 hypothetical protein EGR_11297 [Echinococcus granulosus]